MGLGAPYDNAVVSFFDDMQVVIRVRLLVGGQAAVPFGVGHGAVAGKIVFLYIFEILQKTLIVFGVQFLVHVIGDNGQYIQGIHPDTALKAAPGSPSQQPAHFAFFDQIIDALMDVGKAVDFVAADMGCGSHEVFMFGALRHVVSFGHGLHRRTDDGIIHHVIQFFSKHVYDQIQTPEAFFILLSCHHGHW